MKIKQRTKTMFRCGVFTSLESDIELNIRNNENDLLDAYADLFYDAHKKRRRKSTAALDDTILNFKNKVEEEIYEGKRLWFQKTMTVFDKNNEIQLISEANLGIYLQ